jgi:hypothetical protein
LGNQVSACGDNVWLRRNEISVWRDNVPARGNEVSPRGNEGTDRGTTSARAETNLPGVRIDVYTADNFDSGGALVLLGLPLDWRFRERKRTEIDRAVDPACAR